MTTPNDLIRRALKKAGVLGVGQVPSAEDLNDAFADLNGMLGQWSRKRWLVYHLVDVALPLTGAATYSVGPGGDVDMVRPDRIESAYARILNGGSRPVDVPIDVIGSPEDWAATTVKTITGFPQAVFLDSGYPWGTLHVWPQAMAGLYEVHILFKADLVAFKTVGDLVQIPPEYDDAIIYNLAGRLRISYQEPPDPAVDALARAALNTIKGANIQVPNLAMPSDLPGCGGGAYNIYSNTGG